MYKLVYKNNFFGRVTIDHFEDEQASIDAVNQLKNKHYIRYTDVDTGLYYGWTGKNSKTILGSFWHSILYPSVTDWDIFKIEKPNLYKAIRWYFYINPIAFVCYIGLILAWIPTSSASFVDRVSTTIILLMCFRSLKHEMEANVMKKIISRNKKK